MTETANVIFEPVNELHFKPPYTKLSKSRLCVVNPFTDKWLVYKVKTIDPQRYAVKPNNGIIGPGKNVTITIALQPLADDAVAQAFIATKQKFLVQWRLLPQEPTESPLDLMAKHDGEKVHENKFTCRFDAPPEKSASYKPVNEEPVDSTSSGIEGALSASQNTGPANQPQTDTVPVAPTVAAGGTCPLGSFKVPLLIVLALVALLLALYVAYMQLDV